MPAGPAETGIRERRGGRAADPPAGDGSGRRGERVGAPFPPAAQQQSRRAAFLGTELEPAKARHLGTRDFAHHRGKPAMAQPFLHHRQKLGIVAAIGIENPVWGQTRQSEGRSEQVAPGERPQHLSTDCSGKSACRRREEQRGGGFVARPFSRRCSLVQRRGEAPSSEPIVHLRDSECHGDPLRRTADPFDSAHLRLESGQTLG